MENPRYEILSSLGGGMSEVFKGRDLQTGQQVVIKAMKVTQDAEKDRQAHIRFTREMEIALSTIHPHILQAIGYGTIELNGYVVPFLVYPYIKDGTLNKLMHETKLWKNWPLPAIVDVIKQAAQGLYFLHSQEIVHQDVKPDNFLHRIESGQEGPADHLVHIWLSDFGIARRQVAPNHQTSNIVGTPGYMAPEQLWGFIEPSTDQFALALVARYLLTGCSPYADVGHKSIRTPLTELNDRLWSKEIDEVMLKALAKEADQRFPTILAFVEALHQAITNQISPHFYTVSTEQFRPVPPTAVKQLMPLQAELVFPEIPIPTIQKLEPVDKPLPKRPPLPPVDPRLLELFPLHVPFSHELPARPSMLSWSPDGLAVLCTFYGQEAPGLVHLTGKPETLHTFGYGHLACWSPDASCLAISEYNQHQRRSEVRLWQRNAPSDPALPLFSAEGYAIDGLDWSRQGRLALWAKDQIQIYALPADLAMLPHPPIRQLLTTQNNTSGNMGTLRWSPDGLLLVAGADNGWLACWRADGQGQLKRIWNEAACDRCIYSLAWSADSAVLAVAFEDKRVELWDAHAGQKLKMWKLPRMPQMVSISGQDNTVVIATKQGLFFGRIDEDGPSAKHPGQLLAAWSPVGRELATLDGQGDTRLVVWQR